MLDFALRSPRNIEEDRSLSVATPGVVRRLLDPATKTFVEDSQALASNLHQVQNANSPSGVVLVATLRRATSPALAILKAEHQEGMRLQRDEAGGRFDLEHLNELIVGNNARVYKIALLHEETGVLRGQMVDQQNGNAFADFFMSAFLGCALSDNAEVATRDFVESTMRFVNTGELDHDKRARYATSLVAYLGSPSSTLEAAEFSDRFLEASDRDAYLSSMPPQLSVGVVNKNLNLVPGRGAGIRLWASGVTISASAAALADGSLEILAEEGGFTVLRVRGSLKKFGFGSAPRG